MWNPGPVFTTINPDDPNRKWALCLDCGLWEEVTLDERGIFHLSDGTCKMFCSVKAQIEWTNSDIFRARYRLVATSSSPYQPVFLITPLF